MEGNGKNGELPSELLKEILAQLVVSNAKADEANRKADEALGEIRTTNAELRELRQETRDGFRSVDVRLDELKLETGGVRVATQRTAEHLSREGTDLRDRVTRIEQHLGLD